MLRLVVDDLKECLLRLLGAEAFLLPSELMLSAVGLLLFYPRQLTARMAAVVPGLTPVTAVPPLITEDIVDGSSLVR
jgi:hypothetical protein